MKILITGTDGFVGSNLKKYFIGAGFSVHGTVFVREPGADETKIDIRHPDELMKLKGMNFPVIIHTAGIVDQNAPKKLIFQVNAEGTRNMLQFAGTSGCSHFIQTSSVSVYGPKTLGEYREERTCRRNKGPLSIPYMKSKAIAEEHIERSGVPYTILRLPAVLGRNDSAISGAIIPRLMNGSFYFCGKKDRLVSVICVKNLGSIMHRIINVGPQNDVFHCADYHILWSEFIAEYAKLLNVPMPTSRKTIVSMLTNYGDKMFVLMVSFSYFGAHYRNDKLLERFSWNPPFDWRGAVRDAVDGYLSKSNN